MKANVLWDLVRRAAGGAGIEKLAPHDLRRTCARLCHLAGGELAQIPSLLGHVSIQRRNAISAASRSCVGPCTTRWGLNPTPHGVTESGRRTTIVRPFATSRY